MFCSNCGTTLLDEARFCWKCGTSQTSAASMPATDDALAAPPSLSLTSDSTRIRFSRREIAMGLIVLAVAVVGIIWTLAEFIIHNPQRALDIISITSNVLGILGTLYLAYDLLGRPPGRTARVVDAVDHMWTGGRTRRWATGLIRGNEYQHTTRVAHRAGGCSARCLHFCSSRHR